MDQRACPERAGPFCVLKAAVWQTESTAWQQSALGRHIGAMAKGARNCNACNTLPSHIFFPRASSGKIIRFAKEVLFLLSLSGTQPDMWYVCAALGVFGVLCLFPTRGLIKHNKICQRSIMFHEPVCAPWGGESFCPAFLQRITCAEKVRLS